jgi:hypothetical protein
VLLAFQVPAQRGRHVARPPGSSWVDVGEWHVLSGVRRRRSSVDLLHHSLRIGERSAMQADPSSK